ncbi:hypothetical protein [Parerythrobacter lacustris]|uniref:Uncharacterized protein n=1 Tax=Parerythrobacter lacustris TaxID=2969984 RepID=A0ABT1XQI6_9SPHN|nr:hypothetical protein [Parerythrobacter lacustris]MCR2833497.1 hypothetical protein [Parerythrobacter lacustris]
MQLRIKRSQRDGGLTKSTAIFCLDARAEFTPQERNDLRRYKLQNLVIYNSEAAKGYLDRGSSSEDGSVRGSLKNLAFSALASMRLNITVASLERGQHVECKSLDEVLACEEALHQACNNLRGYLDVVATFDGREVVVAFESGEEPKAIAQSTPLRPAEPPSTHPTHVSLPAPDPVAPPQEPMEPAEPTEPPINYTKAVADDLGGEFRKAFLNPDGSTRLERVIPIVLIALVFIFLAQYSS